MTAKDDVLGLKLQRGAGPVHGGLDQEGIVALSLITITKVGIKIIQKRLRVKIR